ncbi:uncharacterized protein LOC143185083 [Calliopsis andreniformis]|uniref:uncharacterized protein LOC143185083 n=1 Tax=Calliopsis andreniformis TaxID=337506 RepID=UPI003FCDDE1E
MEHKNYATVFYDQSAVSCALSMPDDLRVSISRTGRYKVSMANGVNLKVIEMKPTNLDRRDLIRSTYSIPYDWKFPFGKNGDGIRKNAHDLPLTTSSELPIPELLRIRILRGFKKPGGNAVIDIQRALGRYWMSLVSGTDESSINEKGKEDKRKEKTMYAILEENLDDLALNVRTTIDVATYKSGLERQWKAPRKAQRSIKFEQMLRQRATNKETLEWYKRCLRERMIVPYFQNVTGSCFILLNDCVEKVTDKSLADGLPDKCNESEELCGTCHQIHYSTDRDNTHDTIDAKDQQHKCCGMED